MESLLEQLFEEERKSREKSSSSSDSSSVFPFIQPPQYYRRVRIGKRRSTNPTYMPELRILRRDIRRKYCEMFRNVANNRDFALIKSFFEEYCRPECTFTTTKQFDETSRKTMASVMKKSKGNVIVSSLRDLMAGMAVNYEMMPDAIFLLEDCQIRVKQGVKGSSVICKALIKGTRLYTMEAIEQKSDLNVVLAEQSDRCCSIESSPTSSPRSNGNCDPNGDDLLMESGFRSQYRWVPVEAPMETMLEAVFTMKLDESHHIEQFHFALHSYQERAVSF